MPWSIMERFEVDEHDEAVRAYDQVRACGIQASCSSSLSLRVDECSSNGRLGEPNLGVGQAGTLAPQRCPTFL